MPARRAAGATCLLLAVVCTDASAQFNARGRGPRATAAPSTPQAPRATSGAATAGGTSRTGNNEATRQATLITRYEKLILEQPGEEVPLTRLAELVRQRDGNLNALYSALEMQAGTAADPYAALVAWGGLLAQDDQKGKAVEKLKLATLRSGHRPEAWLLLGTVEQARGNLTEARASKERALPAVHGAERSHLIRSLRDLCLESADYDAAAKYHQVLSTEAQGNLFLQGELGRELLARGQTERAITELRRVTVAAQGDPRALAPAFRDLGEAQLAGKQLDEAIVSLTKASRYAATSPGLRAAIDTLLAEAHRQTGTLGVFLTELADSANTAPRLGLLGTLYEEAGEPEKAALAYQKALALEPSNVDLRLRLVRLYEVTGNIEGAVTEYGKLVKSSPRDVQLSLRYMDMLLTQGRRAETIAELDRIDRLEGSDPTTGLLLLDLAERLEETARTQRILARLSSVAASDPRFLVELGSRYYQAGDTKKAHGTWKRILDVQKDRAAAHVLYGEVLIDHEAIDEGVAALVTASTLSEKDPKTHKSLALGLERAASQAGPGTREKYERDALSAWKNLLRLSSDATHPNSAPDRSLARRHIVRLYKRSGQLDAALPPLKNRLNGTPPDAEAGRLLAEAYLTQGSDGQAISTLKRVLSLEPGDRHSLLQLEAAYTRAGQHDEAIATLKLLVAADPRRAREYYDRMARAASLQNDTQGALKFAELAVEKNPTDPAASASLGDLYLAQGQTQKAEAAYRRALALDDRMHPVGLRLAELLAKTERSLEALEMLFHVIRTSRDPELIRLAARRSLSLSVPLSQTRRVEDVLRPLSIGRPEQPLYRALLLEVLSSEMYPLVLAASHGTAENQTAARASLQELADRSTGPLLAALSSDNPGEQQIAISLLSYSGSGSAASALLAFAEGPAKEEQRLAALLALGRLSRVDLGDRLAQLVVSEGTVRRGRLALAALWALARTGGSQGFEALMSSLRSGDPEMRTYAALGLADVSWLSPPQRAAVSSDLGRALGAAESGPVARAAAALALGSLLSRPGTSAPLQKQATDALLSTSPARSALLTRASLVALTQLSAEPVVKQRIASGLVSSDETVRISAARAAAALAAPESKAQTKTLLPPRLEVAGLSGSDRVLFALARETHDVTLEARYAGLLVVQQELIGEGRVGLRASPQGAHAVLNLLSSIPEGGSFDGLLAPESFTKGQDALHTRAMSAALEIRQAWGAEILALAEGTNTELVNHALRVLRPADGPQATRALAQGLRSASGQKASLSALVAARDMTSLGLLENYLNEETAWGRRRRITQSLGAFLDGDPAVERKARDLLGTLSDDADSLVRDEARTQLQNTEQKPSLESNRKKGLTSTTP